MNLAIFGAGSHAQVVSNQLKMLGNRSPIFVDATEEEVFLRKLVAKELEFTESLTFHVAIGNNEVRKAVTLRIADFLQAAEPIISSTSFVEESANIGKGSFIAPFSYVGIETIVGSSCILNTGSKIDHDVHIGDYSHIGGNSYVAGDVHIGDQVFLGAGCTIIEGVTITSNVTVGAGAVVIDNIDEPGLYVGVPAKLKKKSL